MAVYERSVLVEASFEEVWDFHATIDGLEALTPGWMHLRVEKIHRPDGESASEELTAGTAVTISIRPFGIGPRQHMRTRITERARHENRGYFRDEMAGGPFEAWEHTHRFSAEAGRTRIHDHIEYRLAGGRVGSLLSPLADVGFAPIFWYRHKRTKELLE